ncbi:hypothetical protein R2083_08215 [Nitrosomonas sp. Is35]|uniref:hypothetical protein n=1 Tax=Nitrosomonas sp. Is35 TaxID=3080534 RepID=UPI00294B4932|nr:hypothetical protein [Nitrosomonas sp. Is35]MDV6347498.1 hypothetical protein [Nitrosomonas sp. Is35]
MKRNHLARAPELFGVRTGFNPAGVLKRVIRFKSCEKPNSQPVYLTVPVGLLARLLLAVNISRFDVAFTSGAEIGRAGGFFEKFFKFF